MPFCALHLFRVSEFSNRAPLPCLHCGSNLSEASSARLIRHPGRSEQRKRGCRISDSGTPFFVILTKRATRAAGRISDSFAPAKPVPVSEIAQRSSSDATRKPQYSHRMQQRETNKKEPAALAPRCTGSFPTRAMLASVRTTK